MSTDSNTAYLKPVPTTRVLAIGQFVNPPDLEQLKAIMPQEVTATVRLYLQGKIDQWYALQDRRGPVFIMDVDSVEEAHELLEALPLGKAGLMKFELTPLGPLKQLQFILEDS